jgi:hypothetical protein
MIEVQNNGKIVDYIDNSLVLKKDIVIPADDDIEIDTGVTFTSNNILDNGFVCGITTGVDIFIEPLLILGNNETIYNPIIYNYSLEDVTLKKGYELCSVIINNHNEHEGDPHYVPVENVIYDKDGLLISYEEEGYKVINVDVQTLDNDKTIQINMTKESN